MKRYSGCLLLLMITVKEHECKRKLRRGFNRRRGMSDLDFGEYPGDGCQVRYPGKLDPANPNKTWVFGSCPGLSEAQKTSIRSEHSNRERCCSEGRKHYKYCPNRDLFPEGTFPEHPFNCKHPVKPPEHLIPIIAYETHLIDEKDKVTYPGWENSGQKFAVGTCPGLPTKCHYSQTFSPELCCEPGYYTGERKVRKDCDCPNLKLFPAYETYPGFKDPGFKFPPGWCPGVDRRCRKSPTWFVKGCCSLRPVLDSEGKSIPSCQCPNFELFPSGIIHVSFENSDQEIPGSSTATTTLDGVQQVEYPNRDNCHIYVNNVCTLPRTEGPKFARGACPNMPEECHFSMSFDEDACCDRKTNKDYCRCPNKGLFKKFGSYPGYRDPEFEFPVGTCPGVNAWCKHHTIINTTTNSITILFILILTLINFITTIIIIINKVQATPKHEILKGSLLWRGLPMYL